MQEFNFTVEVQPNKGHANANHLSRLNEKCGYETIDDSFPDAQLFYINVTPQKYEKIIEYLQNNEFLIDFNDKQKRRLVFKVVPYTIIADTLSKQEKDGVLCRCVTILEIFLFLKSVVIIW